MISAGWRRTAAVSRRRRARGRVAVRGGAVRNVVGAVLDGQPAVPLHVVVVGGAGAGKSTIANFLCGSRTAEANPQAGFTRHPVAYIARGGPSAGRATSGFSARCAARIDAHRRVSTTTCIRCDNCP